MCIKCSDSSEGRSCNLRIRNKLVIQRPATNAWNWFEKYWWRRKESATRHYFDHNLCNDNHMSMTPFMSMSPWTEIQSGILIQDGVVWFSLTTVQKTSKQLPGCQAFSKLSQCSKLFLVVRNYKWLKPVKFNHLQFLVTRKRQGSFGRIIVVPLIVISRFNEMQFKLFWARV